MRNLERRYNHGAEHRAEKLDDGWRRQLVAVFDSRTELWPGYFEEVDPGAFARTLREGDPVALFNHDPSLVLGRQRAGTAKFFTDERGLETDFLAGDTAVGRDLGVWMDRGDVNGGSFGFYTIDHTITENRDGTVVRRLMDVDLVDGGPVTFPAYPATARSCGLPVDDELLAAAWAAQRAHSPLPVEYRSALRVAVESLAVTARSEVEAPAEAEAEAAAAEEPEVEEDGEVEPEVDPAVVEAAEAEARDRLRAARLRLAAGQ
jgi:HK97 family phage prohead protease